MKIYKSKTPTVLAISLILIAFLVFICYCFQYKTLGLVYKNTIFGLLLTTFISLLIDLFSDHVVYSFTEDGILNCSNKSEISWEVISDFKIKIVVERFGYCFVFLNLYNKESRIFTSIQLNSLKCDIVEIELFMKSKINL
ncbi:hypothetical protein M2326_001639 [Flavobacterium sp. 7A]|nr:hypothetical protein [Flavobacterium sp. 7A]